jgi:hypothetical protein
MLGVPVFLGQSLPDDFLLAYRARAGNNWYCSNITQQLPINCFWDRVMNNQD